jgi:hypothetical protein
VLNIDGVSKYISIDPLAQLLGLVKRNQPEKHQGYLFSAEILTSQSFIPYSESSLGKRRAVILMTPMIREVPLLLSIESRQNKARENSAHAVIPNDA